MPNRIIRADILTSEAVCALDWASEVFYRRLLSVVDDYGRHEAGIQLLRSKCYPLQTDDVRVADITRWMAACQKAGLIALYEVAGKRYLEVAKFGQQRRTDSKFPPPPAIDINCQQTPSDAHLGVSVSGDVSEDGGGKRGTRLPPDWSLSPEDRDYCVKTRPELNPDVVLLNFRDHWIAKPGKDGLKLNWSATWQTWVRKEFAPRVDKNALPAVSTVWHESAPGIKAKAAELGLDPQDEVMEPFPMFKARVMKAAEAHV